MKRTIIAFCTVCLAALAGCGGTTNSDTGEASLKEALKDKFLIGAALNLDHIWGRDPRAAEIIERHFDAVVAENCMKSMNIQPREGEFFFDDADRFVEYGERNGMYITGHTLVWHSQTPDWFFVDDNGDDVSREVMIERMRNHITTVVSRYKGRIKGWDVVNEAIMEDGSWRESKFLTIIGEDFIPLAFRFAHEADPDAELYYNDYNEWHPGKVKAIVKMIGDLREQGLRIDGVGMQGHIGMDYPSMEEYRAAIEAYAAAGVKVMITELDVSALPLPRWDGGANIADTVAYMKEMNPYTDGLPTDVAARWNARMGELFRLLIDNSENITRVTQWGVTDATSWKNGFPMPGRTDYPLLFDRDYRAKPVVNDIIEMTKQ
uniref:Glycoside hydrolase family 10 protein n=1 Tax=termite gut metagenome TaxID=433724 RepID=S0DDW7_9ZZZZ